MTSYVQALVRGLAGDDMSLVKDLILRLAARISAAKGLAKDPSAEALVRVYLQAGKVVNEKYHGHRPLRRDAAGNLPSVVSLTDGMLATFFFEARQRMEKASVTWIEKLPSKDKTTLGLFALAVDLPDAEFEATCKMMLTVHERHARSVRQNWNTLKEGQARAEAQVRAAAERKLQARSAQEKAFAARHRALDLASAYEAGRSQLQSVEPLFGLGETAHFLLAYGVQRARAATAGVPAVWRNAPAFTTLSPDEAAIVSHIYQCFTHADDTGFLMDLMASRPQVDEATYNLHTVAIAALGHPIERADLPQGTGKDATHWPPNAPLPDIFPSIFDTIMTFHMFWNADPPNELDVPD